MRIACCTDSFHRADVDDDVTLNRRTTPDIMYTHWRLGGPTMTARIRSLTIRCLCQHHGSPRGPVRRPRQPRTRIAGRTVQRSSPTHINRARLAHESYVRLRSVAPGVRLLSLTARSPIGLYHSAPISPLPVCTWAAHLHFHRAWAAPQCTPGGTHNHRSTREKTRRSSPPYVSLS